MAARGLYSLVHYLRRAVGLREARWLEDAQLLEQFAARGDPAAFEALLWRHGPMMFTVCRRILRHEQDAEDAFQATFLTLARKAGSIKKGEAVGAWLHRVACRVAEAAQADVPRHEALPDIESPGTGPSEHVARQELSFLLHREVSRLPDKYRVPLVLVCFEGKTSREVAEQLGCAEATVRTRLARARSRLHRGLTSKGVALTGGLLAACPEPLLALPPGLIEGTMNGAMQFAAGKTAAGMVVSANAVALTERALKAMFLNKLITTGLVFIACAVGAGMTLALRRGFTETMTAGQQPQAPEPVSQKPHLGADREQILEKARQAYLSARQSLKTGRGKGVFEMSSQPKGGVKRVYESGTFDVIFRAPHYRIDLVYDVGKGGGFRLDRQIIMSDGRCIITSLFGGGSPRGEVWGNSPDDAGFSFNPLDLPLVDVPLLIQNIQKAGSTLRLSREGDGEFEFSYRFDAHTFKLTVSEASGFHVTRSQTFNPKNPKRSMPSRDARVTWRNHKGLWYVSHIEERRHFRGREESLGVNTMTFSSFEPNAEVGDDAFRLDALELRRGERILDHRPEAKAPIYWNKAKEEITTTNIDEMLKRLPSEFP